MKIVVAVTDFEWFQILSQHPELNEVNHWAPSGKNDFRALEAGEWFLFKLKKEFGGKIVGGGIFAHSKIVPWNIAWETFEEANGANSLEEFQQRIASLGSEPQGEQSERRIGCRTLTDPFFLDESNWIDAPQNWSDRIVQFKTYDTNDSEGFKLWQEVLNRRDHLVGHPIVETHERFGEPHLVTPRLGQGSFRFLVRDAYQDRCAITGVSVVHALEAAHIRPYHKNGQHEVGNGLLLRRDIHRLFDLGYLTVTPSYKIKVSPSIRQESGTEDYSTLNGRLLSMPKKVNHHPNPEMLAWHNDKVYKG